MSEQRAIYHIAGDNQDQAPEIKPQPVSVTINSEQVRGVVYCVAQKSPELIITQAARILARDPEYLSEQDAAIFLKAIVQKYPGIYKNIEEISQNVKDS